uniref:LRR receptor-like serine/threonine-protein kinase MEE39 n=1 Tax=Cajanus cajan TaxID=3821 RepID=A0A151TVG5_CAJCA|nr:putative LRR receptor-like serine/threonine-protein kinase MEE39 [Cajanus cajan]
MELKKGLLFLLLLECVFCDVESMCVKECDVALASYYILPGYLTVENVTGWLESSVLSNSDVIKSYNKDKIIKDNLPSFDRINVPFPCDCIHEEFLGHVFEYSAAAGDTYDSIAKVTYANLTTVELLTRFNSYGHDIPQNAKINVTVKCSCGNSQVSKDYGLFITYPLRPGNNLHDIANEVHLDAQLLEKYNPGVNFSKDSGIVFIPGRDQNGDYVPLYPSAKDAAVGVSIAGICGLLLLVVCIYVKYLQKKEGEEVKLPTESSMAFSTQDGTGKFLINGHDKTAIKKMDVQASTEFLCELKVLTHVHHLNLVRLIGYCVEGSLFLVYEYIDNGNLGQYLHGTGKDPLPWSSRVQIALDSARGLEYIHEHTVPVYIHRDVKSANILIDKNFRGKVADFGLTKLIEVGGSTLHTRLVGTFGYMPPEYAQYGDVSPKVDVYAFGVVLYELISAKNAILRTGESVAETKGLVALFEEALNQSNPGEGIRKLVDPRLGENYPIDSVLKIAQLGRACTRDNPLLRPSMRSIVVALMTLSSPTEDCEDGASYENQTLINLLSVR